MESIHCFSGKGEERFPCAQSGCQECVNQLLREHRKLVVAVVRRQWLGERTAFADPSALLRAGSGAGREHCFVARYPGL